ncbi:MAG: putative toxin-antitoxin system toxin component, PIN family [Pseudomonadota bacterium]
MRLVLDTNVVVAAMLSPRGASAELLRLAVRKRLTALGTLAVALEYQEVCVKIAAQATISEADASRFANQVIALLEPVNRRFAWRPMSADPNDDMILEAALNGRADALVTFNVRDFATPARAFGLPVAVPSAILLALEQSP